MSISVSYPFLGRRDGLIDAHVTFDSTREDDRVVSHRATTTGVGPRNQRVDAKIHPTARDGDC